MTYHARHIGHPDTLAALLAAGWRLMRMYPPVSPVIPLAVWLRCPAWCCPVEEEQ